ncbi:hypothetical protein ACFV13_05880 [Streptomyces bauhiniae]|uniref:hypothetical protein n=1 Tax=Streptomyces bauhiniae TaxID=2340725 RepID=UPI0036CB2828
MKMRTVISLRSARGGLLSAAMAGSLLFGVTGCGGDDEGSKTPKDYKVVAGTQLCGGDAVSADASRALKVITGSSRFEASEERSTTAQAAADLIAASPIATTTKIICRVFTPIGTPDFQLRATWRLADDAPTDDPSAPKFTELKMGDKTVAAADMAYVYFTCRSDEVPSSSEGAHIVVGVEHWAVPREPDGNIKALKNAYATVAHSFSLAMAKELRCDNNGGLPPKPVLVPA